MPVSPARKIAYQIMLRLDAGRDYAVDLLQRADVTALKEADRALATELVMGVLRWRGELDFRIEQFSGKRLNKLDAEVVTILRMGVYQIGFLERVPKRAVVDDAVELTKAAHKRSAAGFVNAVLRKCDPPKERLLGRDFEHLTAEGRQSVQRAFPRWLLQRWNTIGAKSQEPNSDGAMRLAYASLLTPHTTLRVVDPAAQSADVRRELEAEGILTRPCRYAVDHGLTVESGQVQNTRMYREGRVVIQDEASQLVTDLLSPKSGERVLDLCAAPGMKAGQLAQLLGSGLLVACDRSAARLHTMGTLLPRWTPPDVRARLLRLDAADELPFGAQFDRILLDAPCTGTGTLARNPEIKWRLGEADIRRLAELQTRMLRNALHAVANDGRLVYSTCSLEPEENEAVVEKALNDVPGFRTLTADELTHEHPHLAPLIDSSGYFRTRPDQHGMDGFNAAVIVRKKA